MSDENGCYLYLVCPQVNDKLQGPVKVGITSNVGARLRQLKTGNPLELVAAFAFRCHDREFAAFAEYAFHTVYAPERLTGEWFNMAPRDALAGLCECMSTGLGKLLRLAPEHLPLARSVTGLAEAEALLANIDAAEAAGGLQ